MRIVFTSLIATALLSLILVGTASAQILHLDRGSIDMGDMNQHESRDLKVVMTNKGGGVLVIDEVKADCGCTIPTLSKMQLAPGESTTIDINFNSKQFHGNITKVVHIFSNDPSNSDTSIILLANVFSPLLIDPETQRMGFSQTPIGTSVTKQVLFTATQAPELEIKAKKSRKGLFEISTINNYEGNPQVSALVITVPEEMPPGRQRDNVRVTTNIEGKAYVDIDLSAWPVLALQVTPDKLNFRYKKSFTKTIQVFCQTDNASYKITGIECDLPEVELSFEEITPNHQSKVYVKGSPISKDDPRAIEAKGRIKGTIKIHTTMKNLPVMEVPVTYMVRM